MNLLVLIPKLLIAGGSSFLGTVDFPSNPVIMNHTLAGEKIPGDKVVCRDRWGTPMLPDGKGGYSLIAPIKKSLLEQSLWTPPVSGERPLSTPAPAAQATPVAVTPAKPAGN